MIGRMGLISMRILMPAALIIACVTVFGRLAALEILRTNPPLEGLNAALDWDSRNPEIYYVRAMLVRDDPAQVDLDLVGSDLETGIRLNPHNGRYWRALAQYSELTGAPQRAAEAYRRAVELNPKSGNYLWPWANFLLRNGDLENAFSVMKDAIRLRSELQSPAIELLLRMQIPAAKMWDLWPHNQSTDIRLLQHYVRLFPKSADIWGSDLADRLWHNLMKGTIPITPGQGEFYLQFLFRQGRYQQLRDAWIQIWQGQAQDVGEFAAGRDFIWNGGFESRLTTRPLGWRINRASGFLAELDRPVGNPDSNSLGLFFDGTKNIDFRHVSQAVIVQPGREYELRFRACSEVTKPHDGLFVEVSDNSRKVLAETPLILGTTPWRQYTASITAAPDTQVIHIAVRRRPSERFDNLINGAVWFDDFQLLPSIPEESGPKAQH